MIDFEKWFADQDFYTNMRFIHGDGLFAKDGDVYRVLPVQMTYVAWSEKHVEYAELRQVSVALNTETINQRRYIVSKQSEIDQLKAEKEAVLELAKQWQETARQLSITDDKHVICSLLSCAEEVEKALRGSHE